MNPFGNATVIVSPMLSAPLALEVSATVHVTPAVTAARVVAENVTALGAVAALIVRFGGLAAVTSADVFTDMFAPVIVCAVGFVTPAIVSWPLPAAARLQPAPSVIVTVVPLPPPVVVPPHLP